MVMDGRSVLFGPTRANNNQIIMELTIYVHFRHAEDHSAIRAAQGGQTSPVTLVYLLI